MAGGELGLIVPDAHRLQHQVQERRVAVLRKGLQIIQKIELLVR